MFKLICQCVATVRVMLLQYQEICVFCSYMSILKYAYSFITAVRVVLYVQWYFVLCCLCLYECSLFHVCEVCIKLLHVLFMFQVLIFMCVVLWHELKLQNQEMK